MSDIGKLFATAAARDLALQRAEKAEAAIARVRAICARADNDEFHSPYQVADLIRAALNGGENDG
jgi:hypothetical protein